MTEGQDLRAAILVACEAAIVALGGDVSKLSALVSNWPVEVGDQAQEAA